MFTALDGEAWPLVSDQSGAMLDQITVTNENPDQLIEIYGMEKQKSVYLV